MKSVPARCGVLLLSILALCGIGASQTNESLPAPGTEMIRAKIQGLGVRDDTLADRERPENWLRVHREAALEQLIEGLDDPEGRIAENCLRILESDKADRSYLDALLRISREPRHPIHSRTVLGLASFADEPRVVPVLKEAALDATRFPKPKDRARLAEAAGMKEEASSILLAALVPGKDGKYEYGNLDAIKRLGDLGQSNAIPRLEELSKEKDWRIASESYLALARLDPEGHGLTEAQKTFLEKAWRASKVSNDFYVARAQELANIGPGEIRPFVMQMLESGESRPISDALLILAEWRDREALPEVRQLMLDGPRQIRRSAIPAYLAIDGSPESENEVLDLLRAEHGIRQEEILQSIAAAAISDDRKIEILKSAAGILPPEERYQVAQAVRFYSGNVVPLLRRLMKDEADIPSLGVYAELAGRQPDGDFAEEAHLAVERLAAAMPPARHRERFDYAAVSILRLAIRYDLAGLRDELTLLSTSEATRLYATGCLARLEGGGGHLNVVYEALGSDDAQTRATVSEILAMIPPKDEEGRRAREAVLLSHLGTESEDYALRLLAGCGGERTVKALMPILDEENVPRAVYAAWVLSQLPDAEAARIGFRRLAVYGMIHRRAYAAGSGIDYDVAPGLRFHQSLAKRDAGGGEMSRKPAIVIPDELLGFFALSENEVQFAIRAYRNSVAAGGTATAGQAVAYEPRIFASREMDASYVPLLKVIAAEDPSLAALHVSGRKVPHFPNRQAAARDIARITGEPASYTGFAGETLDSEAFPASPYPNQAELLTAWYFQQRQRMAPKLDPQTGADWEIKSRADQLLQRLRSEFGEDIASEPAL